MEIFTHENAVLTYDPETLELLQTWKGYVPTELFRQVIDATVEHVRKHKVVFLISDTSGQKVVSSSDAEYAASVMKVMIENGLKAMAFVIPENVFTKFSLKKFSDAGHGDVVAYFDSLTDARKWGELMTSKDR
ncbi:hypothetical protein [Geofilum rubicundum]|uniref:STAS/SEC14 domain-containing protein n=1 Tax=Geofilum rubicundum JCM 15548 TaxID=1236989 RepID=A0A0E9LTJ1_9BACT|nr:hypothetical protein [Geofilum rubicundum]GAO28446.1 hypothetical protein JCM15548_1543 [Geofilum rubicundum JCM 15548]